MSHQYNAFISYSHAADDKFAPALQNALQKFAKPFTNVSEYDYEDYYDGSAKIWDVTSGEVMADFEFTGRLYSVDNKQIIIVSEEDKKIKISDPRTNELIYEFFGSNPSLSEDGKKLVIISIDKTARIYITPFGLMDWLNNTDKIYKLTSEDLKGLGVDFIEEKLLDDNTTHR